MQTKFNRCLYVLIFLYSVSVYAQEQRTEHEKLVPQKLAPKTNEIKVQKQKTNSPI